MIKAILFDLWNTLAKCNNWKEAYRLAGYVRNAAHDEEFEKFVNTKAYVDEEELAKHICKLWGGNDIEEVTDLLMSMKSYFFDDVLPAIKKLKEMGFLIGIVSNTNNLQLKKLDLSFADVQIISSEVGMVKPDPKIYELACIELGVKASECIFVGDTVATDFEGPKKAGMTPILISRYNYNKEYKPIKELNELVKRLENG